MFQRALDSPPRLRLGGLSPIRRGGHRLIFEHPENNRALVKIVRLARKSRLKRWLFKHSKSYRFYADVGRELAEYQALQARCAKHPSFIPRILGVVETDRGFGLVVEKMRGRDGGLAPTLDELIRREGMTRKIRDHVGVFCEALCSSRAIVSDLKLANILLGYDEDNGERLVLVDGLGEKTLIPANRFSRVLSRRTRGRHIRRMLAQIGRLSQGTADVKVTLV